MKTLQLAIVAFVLSNIEAVRAAQASKLLCFEFVNCVTAIYPDPCARQTQGSAYRDRGLDGLQFTV
jgi:hypothetical protein